MTAILAPERLSPDRPAPERPAPDRGVIWPTLFVAALFGGLVALGLWQLERLAWKEALIADLDRQLAAPPAPLPAKADWPSAPEFLRVAFTAEFLNDQEALVYTTGSALRDTITGLGYWVVTPARLADGSLVMVNRGFVPDGRQDPASRPDSRVTGPVRIVGVIRAPELPGLFTPPGEPSRNVWFARDTAAIAAAKGLAVAPFYIDMEAPEPPGGLPQAGPLHPHLPNNHLQYAVTWFGLAAVLIGVYAAWLIGRWRARSRASASSFPTA